MPIKFKCSSCGKEHEVPEAAAGRTGRCSCGAQMTVPQASTAPTPAAGPGDDMLMAEPEAETAQGPPNPWEQQPTPTAPPGPTRPAAAAPPPRKAGWILPVVLILVVAGLGAGGYFAYTTFFATGPEAVVKEFMAVANDGDSEALRELVVAEQAPVVGAAQVDADEHISVVTSETRGDTAVVVVHIPDPESDQEANMPMVVVREDGAWKVDLLKTKAAAAAVALDQAFSGLGSALQGGAPQPAEPMEPERVIESAFDMLESGEGKP
ncbi:MAG: hypothetical protein GF320_04660 [Armatimonadia bacterium]|nr:hypothetical protein [Armatimonadia bacterium]